MPADVLSAVAPTGVTRNIHVTPGRAIVTSTLLVQARCTPGDTARRTRTGPLRVGISTTVPDGYTPLSYPRYGTPTCSGLQQHALGTPGVDPATGPDRNVRQIVHYPCRTYTSWYRSGLLFAYIAPTLSSRPSTADIRGGGSPIYPLYNRYLARRSSGIPFSTSANAEGT